MKTETEIRQEIERLKEGTREISLSREDQAVIRIQLAALSCETQIVADGEELASALEEVLEWMEGGHVPPPSQYWKERRGRESNG